MIQAKISFIILLLIQILKYVGANQQSNCQQLFSQKSLVPSQSECLINQGDPSSLTDNTVEFSNNLKGLCPSFCNQCLDKGCITCSPGYYITDKTNLCVLNCDSNQYIDSTSQQAYCRTCNSGCQTCSNSTSCQTCLVSYYLLGNNCLPCDNTCYSCSGPGNNQCIQCLNNNYFISQKLNNVCDSNCDLTQGQYIDQSNPNQKYCKMCISNCKTCSNSTSCQTCMDNYFLSGNICQPCDNTCYSCSGPGNNQCIQCLNNNYFISQKLNNVCDSNCDLTQGQYIDQSNPNQKYCKMCSSFCNICNNSTSCQTCMDKYYLSGNICSPCDSTCKSCSGPGNNQCIQCLNNNYFISEKLNNICDSICDVTQGQYIDLSNPSQQFCRKCVNFCKTCSNSASCQICMDNYYLSGNICSPCHQSCQNCSGPGINQCTICNQSTYFIQPDQNNQCVQSCNINNAYYIDQLTNPQQNYCRKCLSTCKSCSNGNFYEQEQQEQAHFQTLPQLQFLNEDQQPKVSVSTPPLTNQNIPRQLSQNDPFQNSLNEMQSIQSNQRIQKTLDVKQKRDKIQQLYNQQNLRKSSFHNLSQNQIEGKQNQINKQSIFNQGDNNQQKTSQNEIIDNLGCQEDQINKQSKDQEQQGQAQFLTSPKIQLVDDDQELKVSEFEQPQINQNIQCQKSQDDSFSKSPKEIQSIGSNQGYQKVFKMKGKVAKFQELQNYENGLQIIKQNSDLDQNENHLFNTQKTSQNEIIENQDHSTYNTDEKLRFKSGSNLINIKNSCFLNIGISQIDILLNVPSNKPLIIQISQFLTQLGQIIETLPQQKNRYMHDSYLLIILLKYISASQYTDCQQYLSHWGFVPSQSECLINQGSPGSLTNNTVEFNNNIKGLLNNDCINAMQFACPNYYFNVLSSPNCKSDTNFVIQKTSQNLILKIRLYIRIIVNSGQQISASSVYQVNNQNFTDKGYSQTFCNSTYYYRETCPDFCDQCLDVGCIKCSPGYKISDKNNFCVLNCDSDQYIDSTTSQNYCRTCKSLCQTCIDSTSCQVCKDSYYLSDNVCLPCYNNCKNCSGPGKDQCIICLNNYYLSVNTCLPCDNTCYSCSGPGKDQCIQCLNNNQFISEKLNNICDPNCDLTQGQYIDQSIPNQKHCKMCISYCKTCSNSTSCQACIDNYFLSENTCLPCDNTCQSCSGPGKDQCIQCLNNNQFISEKLKNVCDPNCDLTQGQYIDQSNPNQKHCKMCISYCKTCSNSTSCQTCMDKYYLSGNICLPCDSTCQSCLGPGNDQCIQCLNNNYFISEKLKNVCDPNCDLTQGQYIDLSNPSQQYCKKCVNFCKTCSNSSSCQICMDNYYLSGNTCSPCHQSCKNCFGSGINQCTICNQSTYYIQPDQNNQCVQSCNINNAYFVDQLTNPFQNYCRKCLSTSEKIISQVCPEEQIKKQARDQQEYQEQAQVQNPPQLQFLNEGQQPKVSVSTPPLINQNIPCQLSQNGQFQNSPNEMQSIQSNQRIQKIIDVKQKRDKFKQLFNQEKQSESSFKSLSQNQIEGQQNQITKQSIFDQDEKNQQKTSQNQIIENLGYHEDQINKQSKDQECQDQAHFQTSPQKQQVNDDKELRVSESEKPQINQNIESQKSQNCSFSKSPKETLSVELNQRYQKTFKVKGKGAKFQELQNFENELQIKKQKSSHDQNENILFTTQKTSQNEIIENQDHPTQATDENFQSGQTAYLNIDEIPQIPTTSDSFKISIESIFSRSFKA
ncbi:hypothetical protein ABPG73_013248 [Tetrahymena malaccensis]